MESVSEIWKDVQGFEGLYQVSNFGIIKSLARTVERSHGIPRRVRERFMIPVATPKGYLFVTLYRDGCGERRYVHHIVLEAFERRRAIGEEVNHKDGDKSNNRRDNLEYATHADNMAHALATGLIDFKGERSPRSKYTESQVLQGYALVASGAQYKEAAAECGMNHDALEAVCRGENWKHLGLAPIRK